MSPFRKYRTDADPTPFIGALRKMSFHADQMHGFSGGAQRLHQTTPDGEVILTRVNDMDIVDIFPAIRGAWGMVFNFPDSDQSLTGLGMRLNIDLIKDDVRYWTQTVKVELPVNTPTFPLYTLVDGERTITTMYLQVDNIVVPTAETDKRVSCSLSVWENHGTLGEEQEEKPSRVTGMKFICYYSFSVSFDQTKYYPIDGYMVVGEYENWHTFLSEGWKDTSSKYAVDVTMAKLSGDGEKSITIEYLNNDCGTIDYEASGDTDWGQNPLSSIEDDYSYDGVVQPYINKFYGWATAGVSNHPLTLAENYCYYATTYPPSYYLWQDTFSDISNPWAEFHAGLFQVAGAYSEPVRPYYYWFTTIGHTTPYEYETSKNATIYSKDNEFTNTLSISGNPTEVISYDDTMSPNLGNYWSLWRRNTTSGITWQYNNGAEWSPIQLPAKNTRKQNSTIGLKSYTTYSAGTAGSPGEPD